MSRNWLRSCYIVLSGGSQRVVSGGGQTDLRIVFSIEQWSLQAPNMGRFRVYNPSQDLAAKLQVKEYTKIEFYGGYEDNVGLIFSGEIKQYIAGHETAVDTFVDIFSADGESGYNQARVGKTLAAGYTPKDKLQAGIDAMKPFGIALGLVNVDLSQPKFPRGIPLVGMARDIIRQVALSAGATWSIQHNQVKLVDFKKSIPGGTIEMNGRTGMIGWPQQTIDGIMVTSLLNPQLQPHMKLKIDPSAIQQAEGDNNPLSQSGPSTNLYLNQQNVTAGIYTIFKLNRRGDSRGQDWFDISTCIGSGGSLPPSQSQSGYYLGES